LIFITIASVLLGLLLIKSKKLTNRITQSFNWLFQKPLIRILFFSSITFVLHLFIETSMVETSVSFILDLNTFIFYFFFYLVGWILFKSKHLLVTMMRYDWIHIFLAILLATIQGLIIQNSSPEIILNSKTLMVLSSIIVWLFTFGITGLFIRYYSKYSRRMRYISDASYWVYLIHLPLTAILPAFISEWAIPAIAKFFVVLVVTTSICFASYHYFVRATFIGEFLNGRKYSLKIKN